MVINIMPFASSPGIHLTSRQANAAHQPRALSSDDKPSIANSADASDAFSSVSSLARQLSTAATRAELRDASASPEQFAQTASALLKQITEQGFQAGQVPPDTALPDTGTPDRLARAEQAEDFIQGLAGNPFKGLSRDQLTLIIYDDSGAFTLNERRSAWQQASTLEQTWRKNIAFNAVDEYRNTGKLSDFITSVCEHYQGLPLIEQARYPQDYTRKLQQMTDTKLPPPEKAEGYRFTHLLERVAAVNTQEVSSALATSPLASPTTDSGRSLMLSRLYSGNEPAVADGTKGMELAEIGRHAYEYLTHDDRALLSQMYAYAKDQGANLDYVDRLARELGEYRKHDDGRLEINFNNGKGFDAEGRLLTIRFTDEDAATASRILNGPAINSTRLDQGFVRHILDPGFGALYGSEILGFLEQMVTKFSDEATARHSLDSQFFTFNHRPAGTPNDRFVMTASTEVVLKRPQANLTNAEREHRFSAREIARGIAAEGLPGLFERPSPGSFIGNSEAPKHYLLQALASDGDRDSPQPNWLSSLFKWIDPP
nr:hypothetical protein [uncultured Pseudomonas sp.]